MQKIKIKESQLKTIMEQQLNTDFYVDQEGDLKTGEMEVPNPYEMAEKVAETLELHPEYLRDEDLLREFIDALHDVLSQKTDVGEPIGKDVENPFDMSNLPMNESLEEMKNTFNRFL